MNLFINESFFHELEKHDVLLPLLRGLRLIDYKILDFGQHGIAVLNLKNNKVYKFTTSKSEFEIAEKILGKDLIGLPFIYKTGNINGINYYVRDFFKETDDNLKELIGENIDELEDYFYYNMINIRKSETNLSFEFDDKFLDFLENLKRSLKSIGITRGNFDVSGFSSNVMIDNNGNYVLADF